MEAALISKVPRIFSCCSIRLGMSIISRGSFGLRLGRAIIGAWMCRETLRAVEPAEAAMGTVLVQQG